MKRNYFIALFFVACSLSVSAQKAVTFKHSKGETKVQKNPKKVLIMDLSALETYDELGISIAATVDQVPEYLGKYNDSKYIKVGNVKTPNMEAVAALKPDFIITGGRMGNYYDSLSMVAPTIIFGTDTEDFWGSFEQNVRDIAALHGKEKLAEKKLTALRQKAAQVQEKAKADPKKTVLAMHMNGRVMPSGPNSRFGFLYDALDLKPAYIPNAEAANAPRGGERPQAPKLADINPDYLFVFDRNTGIQGVMPDANDIINDDIKSTQAYKDGKVFILPGWIWYLSGSGLTSVDQKITDVGEKLYGLKF
ncbi:ABC transporter substrate-binding protein [Sphingobacterium sp. UT-1RO-CII-1]|uniref:siderophore ABC transporter substrate-binding protein n=1 Tax=Sphingobacterium sp. UT-1RO-CII-1 TaxID=2995225 RepID=UPI00227C6F9E|nr:ABC transporter substrate-binding protein [Sphingobacterium sp. UT-1RO-CII-1]MCY4781636.1 ABC transporter substrate-binding protein [Sphingobacterium sp. UT-1RO-CII-1]